MSNHTQLVNNVLHLQQQRTLEIDLIHPFPKLLHQTKISDLQNTASLSNISSQIKKYQASNTLLECKIKNSDTLVKSLNFINYKIKLLNTEIDDLQNYKITQQKEQIQVENKRFQISILEESKLDTKIHQYFLQKDKLELQKLELELEYSHLEQKTQERMQNLEENLSSLQLEFKLNGHLRCAHRNENLIHIIQFQKDCKNIKTTIEKLTNLQKENSQELTNVMEKRKQEYHHLLSQHLKLLNANSKYTAENEKIYHQCLLEQKTYEYETKRIKSKIMKEKQNIEEKILQLQIHFQKLKKKQSSKKETHLSVLQEIKKINYTKHKMHQEMELQKLKVRNKVNMLEPQISIIDSQIENLNQEKQNIKARIYNIGLIIPTILETHLQIQMKKKHLQECKTQLDTIKLQQHRMINLYQTEIKTNNSKISKLQDQLTQKKKQQKLISLQKKVFLQRNRFEKQKHIKDNNKKILQELENLAKIIT